MVRNPKRFSLVEFSLPCCELDLLSNLWYKVIMIKKALISTPTVVTRKDIHKILMSEVVSKNLDHISPRSDAGILFAIDPSSGDVGDKYFGKKNVRTGLFETLLHLTCGEETSLHCTKISVLDEMPLPEDVRELPFTCTLSSLYTPMVDLEAEEREALAYLLDKPLSDTPRRVSSQKRFPVDDDNALRVLSSRFRNKGVDVQLNYISPTMDIHIDKSNKKRIPVRTVSGVISGSSDNISALIREGIGKGKSYGLGMVIPEFKERG